MMPIAFVSWLPLWTLIVAEIVITQGMLAWKDRVCADWIHWWVWRAEKEKRTMTRKERRFQTLRERKKEKKTRRESHRQRFALRRLQALIATKHGPATAWVCDLQTWKVAYGCVWLCAEFILVLFLLRAVECVLGAIVPATVASVTAVSVLMLYVCRPFLRRLNASWRAFGNVLFFCIWLAVAWTMAEPVMSQVQTETFLTRVRAEPKRRKCAPLHETRREQERRWFAIMQPWQKSGREP